MQRIINIVFFGVVVVISCIIVPMAQMNISISTQHYCFDGNAFETVTSNPSALNEEHTNDSVLLLSLFLPRFHLALAQFSSDPATPVHSLRW